MNGLERFLTASSLTLAVLFTGAAAQAMPIPQFKEMAPTVQANYINALVQNAETALARDHSRDRSADIDKVRQFFDKSNVGAERFFLALALMQVDDAKNRVENPNYEWSDAADAMVLALQKSGVELPDNFFTLAKDLDTKFPPPEK